jgi:hypothetical protein
LKQTANLSSKDQNIACVDDEIVQLLPTAALAVPKSQLNTSDEVSSAGKGPNVKKRKTNSSESPDLSENSESCNSDHDNNNTRPAAFKRFVPIKPKPQIGPCNLHIISPKKDGILSRRLGNPPVHMKAKSPPTHDAAALEKF